MVTNMRNRPIWLILIIGFTFSQVLESYYRGEWKLKKGQLFAESEIKEGFMEMELHDAEISPKSYSEKHKVTYNGTFKFTSGKIGFRFGTHADDEYQLGIIYGVLNPDGDILYAYVFSPEIATDLRVRGDPLNRVSKAAFPPPGKNNESPHASFQFSAVKESDRLVNYAYSDCWDKHYRKLSDQKKLRTPKTDPASPPKKVFVYKAYFVVSGTPKVIPEEKRGDIIGVHREKYITTLESGTKNMIGISDSCRLSEIELSCTTFPMQNIFQGILNYSILISIFLTLGLLSLVYQMHLSRSPSGASRVSSWTISCLIVLDGLQCTFHFYTCILYSSAAIYHILSAILFLYLATIIGFEMKYFATIWKTSHAHLEQAMLRRRLSATYTRFYIILFFFSFMLYKFPNFMKYLTFLLYAPWIPQIIFNVMRDVKRSIHPVFVFGTSISRLAVLFYFFLYSSNFLQVKVDYVFAASVGGFVFAQCGVLVMQRVLGPRFLIPKCLLPKRYNYFRPIPEELFVRVPSASGEGTVVVDLNEGEREREGEGEQNPLVSGENEGEGEGEGAGEGQGGRVILDRTVECSICLYERVQEGENCMVTPCNHVFHKHCLTRWMNEKLECPVCRTVLPFLEEVD